VRALEHVAQTDPALKVPRVLESLSGQAILHWQGPGDETLMVRLHSWLEGECLEIDRAPVRARFEAGRQLACLGKALKDCDPQGAPRNLPWDHSNLGRLRDLVAFIDEPGLQARVQDLFNRYDEVLLPAFDSLRRQVIHNDLNAGNLLFTPGPGNGFAGIIDFGDMIEGPLICDLAVACAYQLSGGPDPAAEMRPLIAGYCEVTPLTPEELELLVPLVECRLLATLLIQGSRASERGEAWDQPDTSRGRAVGSLRQLAVAPCP